MNDQQLLRYARHLLLDEIGIVGQEKFLKAHALIIGAGGLGSPVSMYLASAGVGHITLVDDDVVELSNLQRQLLHTTERLGQRKVDSARCALQAFNPEVALHLRCERLQGPSLMQTVARADVVVDCSDNFSTRDQLNRACVHYRKPLVSGAALGFDGQVSVFDLRDAAAPCYHCLFPEAGEDNTVNCATSGVFAPLVGIVGSMQAAEALKLLVPFGQSLAGRLLCLDCRTMQWRSLNIDRDQHCVVCGVRR
jgi:molybdopterin/thiamine biosynthesis adenylyltransferase